jgi:hypothetical protein
MLKQLSSERIPVESLESAVELYFQRGWTDDLPVVPPTEKRVMDFLDYVGMEPDQVLGEIRERERIITAEEPAINAVMAGCRPEYMPVLVVAVEAISDQDYKLNTWPPWKRLVYLHRQRPTRATARVQREIDWQWREETTCSHRHDAHGHHF